MNKEQEVMWNQKEAEAAKEIKSISIVFLGPVEHETRLKKIVISDANFLQISVFGLSSQLLG